MGRLADLVPRCFEVDAGEFDRDEVESFFAARRDVLLDGKAEPLVLMSKLSSTVQRRWREYLAGVAAAQEPMNGVKFGLKPAPRVAGALAEVAGAVARGEKPEIGKALQKALTEADEPWVALGLSRRTYFRRKKGGGL